jgi:hypothetical protein
MSEINNNENKNNFHELISIVQNDFSSVKTILMKENFKKQYPEQIQRLIDQISELDQYLEIKKYSI